MYQLETGSSDGDFCELYLPEVDIINVIRKNVTATQLMDTVAVAPGSTMLNASASGRDADFPGSRGSGVSGT